MKALLTCAALALGSSALAQDQVQSWVDEEGIVHYTNDPSEIPARYRRTTKQAGKAELDVIPATPHSTRTASGTEERRAGSRSGDEAQSPAYWHGEFRRAREAIARIEEEIAKDEELLANDRRNSFGHMSGGQHEFHLPGVKEAKERLPELRRELDQAKDDLRRLELRAADADVPQSWR